MLSFLFPPALLSAQHSLTPFQRLDSLRLLGARNESVIGVMAECAKELPVSIAPSIVISIASSRPPIDIIV